LTRLIGDKWLTAMRNSNGFVAGGAVRAVFASERINDFDIFFRSQKDFDKFVESLNGEDSPTFSTTGTAWTHCDTDDKMRYQLICAEFGSPEEIIAKFDFTCCMAAWDGKEFCFGEYFLKHASQRRLVFNPSAGFPICSLWRAVKFIKRGWNLPAIEAIKLSLKINHIDIKDRSELKRQLLGIDTLFLKELTDSLGAQSSAPYDFAEAIEFIAGFEEKETE